MKKIKEVRVSLIPEYENFSDNKIATSEDVAFLFNDIVSKFEDDKIGFIALNSGSKVINLMIGTEKSIDENLNQYIAGLVLSNASAFVCVSKSSEFNNIEEIMELTNKYSLVMGIPFLDYISFSSNGDYYSYRERNSTIFKGNLPNFIYPGEDKVNIDELPDNSIRLKIDIRDFMDDVSEPDIIDKVVDVMYLSDRERMIIITFDNDDIPINISEVSVGDLGSAPVHPRELMKVPLLSEAKSIIMLHNHPSGDPKPSNDDIHTTNRMINAANIFGITIKDHIIVGSLSKKTYSFVENNKLGADIKEGKKVKNNETKEQPKFKMEKPAQNESDRAKINERLDKV